MIETSVETKKTISNLLNRINDLEFQIKTICNAIINEKGDSTKNYAFDKNLNLVEIKEIINAD